MLYETADNEARPNKGDSYNYNVSTECKHAGAHRAPCDYIKWAQCSFAVFSLFNMTVSISTTDTPQPSSGCVCKPCDTTCLVNLPSLENFHCIRDHTDDQNTTAIGPPELHTGFNLWRQHRLGEQGLFSPAHPSR